MAKELYSLAITAVALFSACNQNTSTSVMDDGEKADALYRDKHYHRPSDEYDPATWTFAGGLEDLKLLFLVGKRLAFETTMPKWKDGSEFKAIREK